ncbi:MAG: DNA mismatch repair endonuclease MutL [Clostridia bacterium]|nr:DNA mismatch repair endonuclease MutL [Clostridia bacterium]
MSKINVLSSKIYNRIAAGEVVDRPYSVVKELVENSLDAGATQIEIEIVNGGLSEIIIRDNGSGIEKDQLNKALMPHATSKISSIKDLDNILSLGFRGEALASIASVSKITIKSKPKDQQFGAEINCEGNVIIDGVKDCSFTDGTEISVNNLFFNAPARAKFLKSEKSEENEITAIVSRFVLGNPNVAFKYKANGKLIIQSFGDGIESAFCCIHGAKTLDDCFYIDTEKNGIKINGYIGKQYFSKSNRSYQSAFLNGRYVVNQTISLSIANAYSPYLMKRQYPFFVLNISMPYEFVDVNVHPNKIDVRFVDNRIVYGTIYNLISKVLDGSADAMNIVKETENSKIIAKTPITAPKIQGSQQKSSFNFDELKFSSPETSATEKVVKKIEENKKEVVDIFAENKAYLEELERKKQQILNSTQNEIEVKKSLKFVGQALNCFLILEDGEDLYLVDQHAVHERMLFDKFNESIKNADVITQPLLVPYVLNVNALESSFLQDNLQCFNSMGLEIAEFGQNSFKISAIPVIFTQLDLSKFFNEILSDLETLKKITINDLLIEKISQKACKSACKSGDKLTDSEIKILVETVENNIAIKCPHGRPAVIKITRNEIDKWFKRIV